MSALWLSALLLVLLSCGPSDVKEPVEYTGPVREVYNVLTHYSENSRVKMTMRAPVVYEFLNGDREFPDGIDLEFYDESGKLESTLRANHAFYFKAENQWRGRGDVEVQNVKNNEQLNTEELFWKPAQKKIFTEKFVTIKQEEDVLYGTGLDAKEDMSDYRILNITGRIHVSDED